MKKYSIIILILGIGLVSIFSFLYYPELKYIYTIETKASDQPIKTMTYIAHVIENNKSDNQIYSKIPVIGEGIFKESIIAWNNSLYENNPIYGIKNYMRFNDLAHRLKNNGGVLYLREQVGDFVFFNWKES